MRGRLRRAPTTSASTTTSALRPSARFPQIPIITHLPEVDVPRFRCPFTLYSHCSELATLYAQLPARTKPSACSITDLPPVHRSSASSGFRARARRNAMLRSRPARNRRELEPGPPVLGLPSHDPLEGFPSRRAITPGRLSTSEQHERLDRPRCEALGSLGLPSPSGRSRARRTLPLRLLQRDFRASRARRRGRAQRCGDTARREASEQARQSSLVPPRRSHSRTRGRRASGAGTPSPSRCRREPGRRRALAAAMGTDGR